MLVCLLIFTVYFTKNKFKELSRAALRLAALYAAFEVAVFTINPICEVALGYVRGAGSADRENVQGPQEYRAQFLLVITGVLRQHRLGGSCGLRQIFCPNRAV